MAAVVVAFQPTQGAKFVRQQPKAGHLWSEKKRLWKMVIFQSLPWDPWVFCETF